MQLGVHLYDDYDEILEESDDDVLRVFTPPPRFDTPSPDDSPRLFSGLQTPESADSMSNNVFQYPPILDTLADSLPHATSTPTRVPKDDIELASREFYSLDTYPCYLNFPFSENKYLQGPPGHRVPELEDFSLDDPAPIHTCETQQEHSSNLFFMFASR